MLVGLLIQPALRNFPLIEELNYTALALTLAAGVRIVSVRRATAVAIVILLIVNLTLRWTSILYPSIINEFLFQSAQLIFLSVTASVIVFRLLSEDTITTDMVLGGISGYFLLGLVWANVFGLVVLIQPDSFLIGGEATSIPFGDIAEGSRFFYFSFVTLTTLGYGDIVPAPGSITQQLAALEAVTGQLYVAILVARLVALNVMQARP